MTIVTIPGIVYFSGDPLVFGLESTIAASISVGTWVSVKDLNGSENRLYSEGIKVFSSDGKIAVKHNLRKLSILRGGSRSKKMLRPVIIGALKAMEFSGVYKPVKITVGYGPENPPLTVPSTAITVGTIMALSEELGLNFNKSDIWKIAFEAERASRKTPSILETTLMLRGGVVFYRKDEGYSSIAVVESDKIPIIIADSGRERNYTPVPQEPWTSALHKKGFIEHIKVALNHLNMELINALSEGDLIRLGYFVNIAHSLIRSVKASSVRADDLVSISLKMGALGAKLVRIGNGVIMVVSSEDKVRAIESSMKRRSRFVHTAHIDYDGVKPLSEEDFQESSITIEA